MDTTLTIRLPIELRKALDARKLNSATNISAFCRRAIVRELLRSVVDEESAPESVRRTTTQQPVLLVSKQETK